MLGKSGVAVTTVLAGLLACMAPVHAADYDTETTNDLRCIVAAGVTIESNDGAAKVAGLTAMMYFFGRLDGHSPDIDLTASIADIAQKMSPEDIETARQSCSQIMKDRGQALQDAGQNLIDLGKKQEHDRNLR
jgi:hypothetical protein